MEADVGAHLFDREGRRVRREDRVRRCLTHGGEHFALDGKLLEDGLEHEIAPGEAARFDDSVRHLLLDRGDGGFDASRVDVVDDDRHLQAAREERRELRRHEAGADDADLRHRARRHVRQSGRTLRPALDDREAVDGVARLRADEQLAHRLRFGVIALLDRPVLRSGNEVERDIRRACRAVNGVVDARARLAHDRLELRPVGLDTFDLARECD